MSDSRNRIWFALFVLVVFCLGGAGGFILGRHVPPFAGPLESLDRPPGGPGFARGRGPGSGPIRGEFPSPFGRGPAGPAGLPPEVAGRLANELEPDDAQRAEVRPV